MKLPYLIFFLLPCIGAKAGLALSAGDVFEWSFSLSPGGDQFARSVGITLAASDNLALGDQMEIELFEDDFTEARLRQYTFNGTASGADGLFMLISMYDYFQDRNGSLRINMTTGSAYIQSITVVAGISGVNHRASIQPATIPEPTTYSLFFSILATSPLLGRKKRPARNETT